MRLALLVPMLVAVATSAAAVASAAASSDVCKPVSAAYVSKGGPDVLHVQYQPSAGHLRVCTQRRPTCCSSAMEDWLQGKAKAELYQLLYQQLVPRSTALASLVSSMQSLFLQMLNASHQDLDMNLKSIYGYSYIENKQPFTLFFDQLRAYIKGGPDTIADVTRTLFENIAARVYVLIMTNYDIGEQYLACVKQQLTSLRPLGQVPDRVGQEFTRAFVTARRFLLGLAALQDAVESAPTVRLSDACQRSRLRSQYCAWCDGHAGVQPCYGLCAQVVTDCLAPLDPLAEPFDQLVAELTRLADKVEGANNLYQVLHQLGLRISGGIMDMQERKENFQAQVAKACGQPKLKAGGSPGAIRPPSMLQPASVRRRRSSSSSSSGGGGGGDMFGWEYRGKDEPVAKGDQQERLTQIVRVARQELTTVRGLFRWDRLARTNCQPDPAPPARCWNGTDLAVYAAPPPRSSPEAASPPDAESGKKADNLRSAHRLAAELPRSDNFADFHETRLDAGLGRLLKKRASGGGGGGPAVITDALPGGRGGGGGGGGGGVSLGGSGSGAAPPPRQPPRRAEEPPPQPGGPRLPLLLSTLPPMRPPPRVPPPQEPPSISRQPDSDVDSAGPGVASGDSSPPPPAAPVTPGAPATAAPPATTTTTATTTRTTTQPTLRTQPPAAQTQPPPRPPVDLEGSGTGRPPTGGPPPPEIQPTPPLVPGAGSGVSEPTDSAPQQPSRPPPSQRQTPPPFEPPSGPSGDVPPPGQPDGPPRRWSPPPVGPATIWPPLPPPNPDPPGTPQQPPQPPPQQPDPNADLWLPKEPNEQGGAEKNRGEGSIHSPMKMTEAKRACPPGSLTCPACRPAASALVAVALPLLVAGLLRFCAPLLH